MGQTQSIHVFNSVSPPVTTLGLVLSNFPVPSLPVLSRPFPPSFFPSSLLLNRPLLRLLGSDFGMVCSGCVSAAAAAWRALRLRLVPEHISEQVPKPEKMSECMPEHM